MGRRYGWDVDYTYNVFGADEHLRVNLYKRNKSDTKWKPIESWCYSTFLSSKLANSRAERRIKRLKSVYSAESI